MGALFEDLHDVAQVLAEHISEETGIVDVQAGAPREATATAEPGIRITMLYSTPQPAHRNDPFELSGGDLRPPPLSLSCFYLVTASGADGDDPVAAHHALGQVMRLYHDVPSLQLPLSAHPGSPPGVFTELGEGELTVTQVPVTLEQVDHIWTPLSERLQPWVLFEVAPVQLVSRRPDTQAPPVVRPGGIVMNEKVGLRPELHRSSPQPARPGGRVRVTVVSHRAVDSLWLGGVHLLSGDPALVTGAGPSGVTTVLDLSRGGLATLGAGTHSLTISEGGLASRTASLRLSADVPLLDAAATPSHHAGTDLVLTGAGLNAVQDVVVWPDSGIGAPSDVHDVPFTVNSADALTVRSFNGLADLPAAITLWRLAARHSGHHYTPYVVLELRR